MLRPISLKSQPLCEIATAVQKTISVSEIDYDPALVQAWLDDKLDRRAAWSELRAVARMMEACMGTDALARSRFPDGCHVDPLPLVRVREVVNGVTCIRDKRTGDITPVLPDDFDVRDRLVVNHTIDRASIGSAAMAFVLCFARLP